MDTLKVISEIQQKVTEAVSKDFSVWDAITGYAGKLDWMYIITFILICYGIKKMFAAPKVQDATRKMTSFVMKDGLRMGDWIRTIIAGGLYGIILYYIRGYKGRENIEMLFNSFIFAVALHSLILNKLEKWVDSKFQKDA